MAKVKVKVKKVEPILALGKSVFIRTVTHYYTGRVVALTPDVVQLADAAWIAAPRDVVKDGELPPTWGLLVVRGRKLVQAVEAPHRTAAAMPIATLAALLRRAQEESPAERMVAEAAREAAGKARDEADARWEMSCNRLRGDLKELRDVMRDFEVKTGLRIDRYGGGGGGFRHPAGGDRIGREGSWRRRDTHGRRVDAVAVAGGCAAPGSGGGGIRRHGDRGRENAAWRR